MYRSFVSGDLKVGVVIVEIGVEVYVPLFFGIGPAGDIDNGSALAGGGIADVAALAVRGPVALAEAAEEVLVIYDIIVGVGYEAGVLNISGDREDLRAAAALMAGVIVERGELHGGEDYLRIFVGEVDLVEGGTRDSLHFARFDIAGRRLSIVQKRSVGSRHGDEAELIGNVGIGVRVRIVGNGAAEVNSAYRHAGESGVEVNGDGVMLDGDELLGIVALDGEDKSVVAGSVSVRPLKLSLPVTVFPRLELELVIVEVESEELVRVEGHFVDRSFLFADLIGILGLFHFDSVPAGIFRCAAALDVHLYRVVIPARGNGEVDGHLSAFDVLKGAVVLAFDEHLAVEIS